MVGKRFRAGELVSYAYDQDEEDEEEAEGGVGAEVEVEVEGEPKGPARRRRVLVACRDLGEKNYVIGGIASHSGS